MTIISKPVTRRSGGGAGVVRVSGKVRDLVVTLHPNGLMTLRPLGTRQRETIGLIACYNLAIKMRVREQKALQEKKKGRR